MHGNIEAPQTKSETKALKAMLIVGAVFITLLVCGGAGVLFGLPALHRAQQVSAAENNLRMLTQSLVLYTSANQQALPTSDGWMNELGATGFLWGGVPVSPAEDGDGESYIYVRPANTMDGIAFPWTTIVFYEDPDHFEDFVLVAFADGSVRRVPKEEFETMLREQEDAAAATTGDAP